MPRIRCLYADCTFIENGYCDAASIQIDPDIGCTTYAPLGEAKLDNDWDDEEDDLEDWDTENDEDTEGEDDDNWLDDI